MGRIRPHFAGYYTSPLRYPGGKGRLGPWLSTVVDSNGLRGGWYVEPYAGGAGAALYLLMQDCVDQIVINDDDRMIHSFWQSVVHDTDAFVDLIRSTPVTMEQRRRFEDVALNTGMHSTLEVGFATFFLNRTSRSGILTGGVIGGKEQSGRYRLDARYNSATLIERIRSIGRRRSRITVLGMDALQMLVGVCDGLPKNTLLYLDPPYFAKGSLLYKNHYDPADHEEIASFARCVELPLLITYDNCPQIRRLYRGMSVRKFSLHYSTHTERPNASELLIHANVKLPSTPKLTRSEQLC